VSGHTLFKQDTRALDIAEVQAGVPEIVKNRSQVMLGA